MEENIDKRIDGSIKDYKYIKFVLNLSGLVLPIVMALILQSFAPLFWLGFYIMGTMSGKASERITILPMLGESLALVQKAKDGALEMDEQLRELVEEMEKMKKIEEQKAKSKKK